MSTRNTRLAVGNSGFDVRLAGGWRGWWAYFLVVVNTATEF